MAGDKQSIDSPTDQEPEQAIDGFGEKEISLSAERAGKPVSSGSRRPRILPVLILAAFTAIGLRTVDFVRDDGLTALFAGNTVDLGPGRPLMAQDAVEEPQSMEPSVASASSNVACP